MNKNTFFVKDITYFITKGTQAVLALGARFQILPFYTAVQKFKPFVLRLNSQIQNTHFSLN